MNRIHYGTLIKTNTSSDCGRTDPNANISKSTIGKWPKRVRGGKAERIAMTRTICWRQIQLYGNGSQVGTESEKFNSTRKPSKQFPIEMAISVNSVGPTFPAWDRYCDPSLLAPFNIPIRHICSSMLRTSSEWSADINFLTQDSDLFLSGLNRKKYI